MRKMASTKRFLIALVSILLTLQTAPTFAQFGFTNEIERELSYAEMWAEILACKEKDYNLENALVTQQEGDIQRVDSLMKSDSVISANVNIYNVQFQSYKKGWLEDYSVQFHAKKLHFKGYFHVSIASGLSIFYMQDCIFDGGLSFFPEDKIFNIQVYNCKISNYLDITLPEKPTKEYKIEPYVSLSNCEVHLIGASLIYLNEYSKLYINESNFSADSSFHYLTIYGEAKAIEGDNNRFDINLDFSDLDIVQRIEFTNTRFNTTCFKSVDFPSYTSNYLKWSQFRDGLSILVKPEYDFIDNEKVETSPFQIFNGSDYSDSLSEIYYDQLMATYNEFFRDYKARGDTKSANACYISMKDVETQHLEYLYKQSGSTDDWFSWKLNTFLDTFADYGTNPVKAIIFSIWTILGFAFLYFFFYSSWDKINRSFLIRQHRKILLYFRTKQSMKDFYTKEYKEEFFKYQDYKRELKASKGIPYFLLIFGRPLYNLAMLRFRWMIWWFNRTEIMHSSWADLPKEKRFKVTVKTFLSLSIYILYLVFIRALNSIMLSINAFSTLGFGDIPVVGVSRYLAIIEGFIGWFLLSIFSVSLISQILQN